MIRIIATVFASALTVNGATTTSDGRLFLVVQPRPESGDPQVVEVRDGKPVPFPDVAANSWRSGEPADERFVGINSIRIGPDGKLWIVDRGATGIGKPLVAHGPKLMGIDVASGSIVKIYHLASVTTPKSFIDDVRFRNRTAYLTDAGQPGLVVLDLDSGHGRRVLDGDITTTATKPLIAEGKPLQSPDGRPIVIHADQLEVSPDGRWLYFQPCSGGMSRIETRYLDEPTLVPGELARHVMPFADTPSTGGTAMAADGTIYLSDVDHSRILAIAPTGEIRQLIADSKLAWVDAMWIDDRGNLLMPAAQLNRIAGLNGGKNLVNQPIFLYRINIGVGRVAS